jgi:branched-chain amino acid transport system permease protein
VSDRLFAQQSAEDWLRATEGSKVSNARSLGGAMVLALVTIAIGLVVLAFGEPYQQRLAFAAYVNIVVVVGLQIFMGNSNVANLSHAGFMGVGAYMTAVLATPVAMKAMLIPNAPFGLANVQYDPITTVLIATLVVAVIAVVTGVVLARLNGIAATILTLALLIIIHSVIEHWSELFRGNQAFFGIPKEANLEWGIVAGAIAIIVARLFRDSRTGVQLRACADNELAARAMGVNVWRLRLLAWVLGGIVCGIGGVLFSFYMGTINQRSFYFHQVFLTLAMLILGGMRTVTGAVIGVIVLSTGMELIRYIEGGPLLFGVQLPEMLGLSGLALGIIIVGFMIWRPDGLMANLELDELLTQYRRLGRWLRPRALVAETGTPPANAPQGSGKQSN